MCDVMPTISEDGTTDQDSQGGGDEANFEQLMVNMLDERDKLMESLRESREGLEMTQGKMGEIERERDALLKQLQATTPQVGALFMCANRIIWFIRLKALQWVILTDTFEMSAMLYK